MEDNYSYFPFYSLNDVEFEIIFGDYIDKNYYETLMFNPCEEYDRYTNDRNPDNTIAYSVDNDARCCSYLDTDDLNVMLKDKSDKIKVLSFNIRSLPKNLDEFMLDIGEDNSNTILAFTETRLSHSIERLYNVPGFTLFTNSRNTAGGGVAVCIPDTFVASVIDDCSLMLPEIETIALLVKIGDVSYVMCNVYRPPNCLIHSFI